MTKRAYKLQEFVAHASNVNCLKIGKKSSRVLVTGGEDHKVNMWAIGKPNAILSLSGHSSAVESVTFDYAECLVVAGAATGTIKLWDLEEAKVVRTLTGHRSNCISVDFHPFGEVFASGSLDTNLKIWDIRRKGCIHTYKGHTRGVNAMNFSPDGRWVVSGGEDNTVKLWDLTAGKLMHDFKYHEGQIHCLDFHPHEFLLATGSADRTAKFWDLETFELIGSAGPETTGVRSMIFNPDGRTLLCGLHESLKVFSWEPLRCHDSVDVGWSKLADLNIHEGKLLGCSYNQNCVGIWVVDLSRVGPYAVGSVSRTNKLTLEKLNSNGRQCVQQLVDDSVKNVNGARSPSSHSLESGMKGVKLTPSMTTTESVPITPQRVGSTLASKSVPESSTSSTYLLPSRKSTSTRLQPTNIQPLGRPDIVPVIVPRNSVGLETSGNVNKDVTSMRRTFSCTVSSKANDVTKSGNGRENPERTDMVSQSVSICQRRTVCNDRTEQNFVSRPDTPSSDCSVVANGVQESMNWIGAAKCRRKSSLDSVGDPHNRGNNLPWPLSDDSGAVQPERQVSEAEAATTVAVVQHGRARSLVESWEKRERGIGMDMHGITNACLTKTSGLDISSFIPRGDHGASERDWTTFDDMEFIKELMQQHATFTSIMQSRLTKLQVIRQFWAKTDLKDAIEAIGKMGDHSVLVDVVSVLIERNEVFTLEICAIILPLLTNLLSSEIDRYLNVALGTLLILVRSFGHVIFSTRAASPSLGVDLQAEQRRERCKACYKELEKVKQSLVPLIRKSGPVAKSAQELSATLQQV
eukprot:Gb_19465 [translate_table: standard]